VLYVPHILCPIDSTHPKPHSLRFPLKARLETAIEELSMAVEGCEGATDVNAAELAEANEIIAAVQTA